MKTISSFTDDNADDSGGEEAHNRFLEESLAVLRPGPRLGDPRPVNCCLTLMRNAANYAARMLPSRLRNWLVPTQHQTAEMMTRTAAMAGRRRRMSARRKRISPTSYMGMWMINVMTLLGLGMGVALGLLLVYIFVYKQAASLMKTASSDRYGESDDDKKSQSKKPEEGSKRPKQSGKCVLPAFPEHGVYIIQMDPSATPGQSFDALVLTVNCSAGYRTSGAEIVFCVNGTWSHSIPKCVRSCELGNNPSGGEACSPECGRVPRTGVGHIIDGRSAKQGEVPWHVGIYRTTTRPYLQICGGSLISNRVVITAAHCFWDDITKQQDASMYAVAAGKIYRPWNNSRDRFAQKSNVKAIKIPVRFQGNTANYQDDIAVVILETAFKYTTYVAPVCMDLNNDFEKSQLQPGNYGKLAGWGLTAENGGVSQVLKVVDLPYVDIEECIAASPFDFREYITSDKICAGYRNGTAPCKGDSGGGLAFPETERGTERYYLRGIVSTAANNGFLCNSDSVTAFTCISKHKEFIEENLYS